LLGETSEPDLKLEEAALFFSMSLAKPGHLALNLHGEDFHVLDLLRYVEVLDFGFTIRRRKI
jgi:hypothetical protein